MGPLISMSFNERAFLNVMYLVEQNAQQLEPDVDNVVTSYYTRIFKRS